MEDDKLYYLENRIYDDNESQYILILFDIENYFPQMLLENENQIGTLFFVDTINKNNIPDELYTGFVVKKNGFIRKNNNNSISKHFIRRSATIRSLLRKYRLINEEDEIYIDQKESSVSYSYHVNVGHGNCSIIFVNNQIFMIDCSEYDYLNRQSYWSNIVDCLNYIKNKFNLKNVYIGVFVLTHSHFDHYSGIIKLIRNDFITEQSKIIINTRYACSSPTYSNMLQELFHKKSMLLDPWNIDTIEGMEIMYPANKVVLNDIRNKKSDDGITVVQHNPNDSSIVSCITSNGITALFPGDLEKKGWNEIYPCNICSRKINYFALSHHGSINGFERNVCPKERSVNDVSSCITNPVAIFLGRRGAYNGIPSRKVLNKFSNYYSSSEDKNGKQIKFFELDWSSGKTIYHY